MKHFLPMFSGVLLYVTIVLPTCPAIAQTSKTPAPAVNNYNSRLAASELLFTENGGQVTDIQGNLRPDILFTAHSNGAKVFITATGIHYQFEKTIFPQGYEQDMRKPGNHKKQEQLRKNSKTETHRFTLSLQGANPTPMVRKENMNDYTENFYLAHCPTGITGVHTYSKIIMEDVYPGIDWVIYSKGQGLEYDFIVKPGADPSVIKLKANDAQAISIAADGGLLMKTGLGEVKEAAPVSYCNGATVATSFRQEQDGIISFTIAGWDKTRTLTIDPTVSWATYYGNFGYEDGYACAVDGSGNVYLVGGTESTFGIASAGFQNTFGGDQDAFIVKFSSSGARLWASYYGGIGVEYGYGCTVDGSGNVYLTGDTESASGIASGGFQNTFGGDVDAFIAKFSTSGARLWASYYGGPGYEEGITCAVDGSGNVFLSGYTESFSGIASGGFQNTYGGGDDDAYLVKFSSTGTRLWATYYGGSGSDESYGCCADASGNVYLSGGTESVSGISSGGFQNIFGGSLDAFLVKFSSTGARLWATYYGGSGFDVVYACINDGSGNVYVAGATESLSGIASGGFQNTNAGNEDAFITKFSSTGTRLWASYYGGSESETGYGCATDALGNVYLSGNTGSTSGIASGGFQNTFGGTDDAFIVKFSSSGSRLWGSYRGGADTDIGLFCKTDGSGNVYLPGFTNSTSGIASGGFQNTFGGVIDAFLIKINGDNPVPVKLISFTAQKNGTASNRIEWRTVLETVGTVFTAEHSADGRSFSPVTTVAGKSETGASYIAFDNNPFSTITYYRLKATEKDGTLTYSNIVAVRTDGKNAIIVAPVPAKTSITITNTNALLNGTKAIITDLQGREVHRFTLTGASFINVSSWASGVYNLRLNDGSVIRLMKD